MFREILVPLDGSPFAEAALPFATQLALASRARLHLLMAHAPAGALIGLGDMIVPPPELDESRRLRERSYLASTTIRLRSSTGMSVGFHDADGPAGPAICEEATRLEADLVVMATHGSGSMRRIWLGSVADYVIRHLSVPVLLIPPAPGHLEPLRRILVAHDLSQDANAIFTPLRALARLAPLELTLVHVVEMIFEIGKLTSAGPIMGDAELMEASRQEAARELERIAEGLREPGIGVTTRVMSGINAAGGLLEALGESSYDAVALTTHGRGGLRRLLLGSVADKVIRTAQKPVLVLRPPPR